MGSDLQKDSLWHEINWKQRDPHDANTSPGSQILSAQDKQAVKGADLHPELLKAEVSYALFDPPHNDDRVQMPQKKTLWMRAAILPVLIPDHPIFLPFSIFTATVTASLGLSLSIPTASAMTTCPKQPSPRGLPSVSLEVQTAHEQTPSGEGVQPVKFQGYIQKPFSNLL